MKAITKLKNTHFQTMEHDHLFKFVVLGKPSTGNSSLVHRFATGDFPDFRHGPVIGADFLMRTVPLSGRRVKVQLWDVNHFDRFNFEWNYNYAYSWMIGAEVNDAWYAARPERFAEWGFAKAAAFYPSVFDERTAVVANSTWHAAMNHFVMYVRGAAGIKDLTPVQ